MKLLIFPGYSIKNKPWAHQTRDSLKLKFSPSVVEWRNWASETSESSWSEWIDKETQIIIKQNDEKPINLLAKSIGTAVAMNVIKTDPNLVNKMILCGIPLNDLNEEEKSLYAVLRDFPELDVLCLQNQKDHHGSFLEVREFIHLINPNIKVISKPRDNHEYPYTEDFINFFEV